LVHGNASALSRHIANPIVGAWEATEKQGVPMELTMTPESSQSPRLSEHTLDHARSLIPLCTDAIL